MLETMAATEMSSILRLSLSATVQLSVDSPVVLIFTESSRQKKAVLLQNGETSTLQKQRKMVQIEHNHFFVKYQRKSNFLSKNSLMNRE